MGISQMTLAAHAQKQAQAATSHDILIRRLDELRRRKDLLVDAFVYKRALDQQTYREQLGVWTTCAVECGETLGRV